MTAKVGFIGTGNMGAAIIKGLASFGNDLELHGTDLHREGLAKLAEETGLTPHDDAPSLAAACDYIVLAVKPQHAAHALGAITRGLSAEKCLLSIAAGIPTARLSEMTDGLCPVVRVMPSTPALVNAGVFAVCLDDPALDEERKAFCATLFEPCGQVHVLPENLFDAFTGVIGSGPAYVVYFMEAMVESAVTLGLPRPMATKMVEGLFSGTAKMVEESGLHLAQLREMVTSPGGTTIRALNHFDRLAVRAALIDGVRESYLRSIELGK